MGFFDELFNPVPVQNQLSVEKVYRLLRKNKSIVLVDVREPWENQGVRIPGSILIPINNIQSGLKKLKKKDSIIFYCSIGPRSMKAYHFFSQRGYKNLFILKGGMDAWINRQKPVENPGRPKWILGKGCEG